VPKQVISPIFIVGAPRSGTNIFFRTFAKHPDLAWISNITKKIPSSLWLTRCIMLFRNDHRPTETNNVWQKEAAARRCQRLAVEDDGVSNAECAAGGFFETVEI
jgi:hypothetical protein